MGKQVVGHIEIARGGSVTYGGEIRFGNGYSNRGKLQWWDNATGHYRVNSSDRSFVPLPQEKYR